MEMPLLSYSDFEPVKIKEYKMKTVMPGDRIKVSSEQLKYLMKDNTSAKEVSMKASRCSRKSQFSSKRSFNLPVRHSKETFITYNPVSD
jgi:hypothetical protein